MALAPVWKRQRQRGACWQDWIAHLATLKEIHHVRVIDQAQTIRLFPVIAVLTWMLYVLTITAQDTCCTHTCDVGNQAVFIIALPTPITAS